MRPTTLELNILERDKNSRYQVFSVFYSAVETHSHFQEK